MHRRLVGDGHRREPQDVVVRSFSKARSQRPSGVKVGKSHDASSSAGTTDSRSLAAAQDQFEASRVRAAPSAS
ncbi:MAG: hypothetical protein U0575_01330 [Phycisphaerales bacterium]